MPKHFTNAPDWPTGEAPPRAHDPLDNKPPLEAQITMAFEEELRAAGLDKRILELSESAGRAPACDSPAIAGKLGDLLSMARAAGKAVDELREKHNRPVLNAQRALKAKADGFTEGLATAMRPLKARLDAYIAEEARKRREAERAAEQEAAAARAEAAKRAAAAEAEGREAAPAPEITPAKIEAPQARGDLGTLVSARKVWRFEREAPIAKLPKAILENEKVVAAIDQVIGAMVRNGDRKIKGVRIWEDVQANIR